MFDRFKMLSHTYFKKSIIFLPSLSVLCPNISSDCDLIVLEIRGLEKLIFKTCYFRSASIGDFKENKVYKFCLLCD